MTVRLRRRAPRTFDRPWRELEYATIDVETTGLDLRRDTIASYGIALISGGRMLVADQIYGLVRPECQVSPRSVTVHALRPADLVQAPPLSQAVAVLAAALTDRILIAHAAWVERAFLTRAFDQHRKTLSCRIIDTAALARAAGLHVARGPGEPDLEQLATELHLPAISPHHALGDAITTSYVFFALAARLDHLGYRTARDFIDLTDVDRYRRR